MRRLIIIILFFISIPAMSQTKITWKTLSDVSFTDKYIEEEDAYVLYPHFGSKVKSLQGKEVFLKGYLLIMDPDEGIYILSRAPFSSCFFCGNSGPESIVELKLKPNHPNYKMDQIVTIKGKLRLNKEDIYHCNYIFEGAESYNSN